MGDDRINKTVFNYCRSLVGTGCKNWHFCVLAIFRRYDSSEFIDIENVDMYKQLLLNKLQANVTDEYIDEWTESLLFLIVLVVKVKTN